MKKGFVTGFEKEEAIQFMNETIEIAKKATCLRSKCGAKIVKDGKIIGSGYNSPPGNLERQRICHIKKSEYTEKVTDKTCCIHAEQRAIIDALKTNPNMLENSTLYFARLNEKNVFQYAGDPYCTICSKFALDAGIAEFVLWHKEGIYVYGTEEYNDFSFGYRD